MKGNKMVKFKNIKIEWKQWQLDNQIENKVKIWRPKMFSQKIKNICRCNIQYDTAILQTPQFLTILIFKLHFIRFDL